mmetsp:Transcript_2992/g.9011  ORF Transcript_2992/g.9011 Transcript_2992/m.9011 type:complete len:203 (-) Transcript_2992:190-798(-)
MRETYWLHSRSSQWALRFRTRSSVWVCWRLHRAAALRGIVKTSSGSTARSVGGKSPRDWSSVSALPALMPNTRGRPGRTTILPIRQKRHVGTTGMMLTLVAQILKRRAEVCAIAWEERSSVQKKVARLGSVGQDYSTRSSCGLWSELRARHHGKRRSWWAAGAFSIRPRSIECLRPPRLIWGRRASPSSGSRWRSVPSSARP